MNKQTESNRMLYSVTESELSHLLVNHPLLFREVHNDGLGMQEFLRRRKLCGIWTVSCVKYGQLVVWNTDS